MINEEEIEVLDEDFSVEEIEVLEETQPVEQIENNNDNIIELDRIINLDDEEVIDVYEENQKKEEKNQKIITKVQIGLLIFLVVFGCLFYFFGYDLVEPYIKID